LHHLNLKKRSRRIIARLKREPHLVKKNMKYQLVVFDLAGTTVKDNRDVHRVLQAAMHKHDIEITLEDANDVMGIPKPVAIEELIDKRYWGKRVVSEDWIESIHQDFILEMIHFYETDASVGEKEGVSETFKKLKEKGIKIAVDTGFDRGITNALLSRLGWLKNNLVDCSVTSDEVANGRPYPDMIYEAMRRTAISNSLHVVKVGDTVSDILEGRAAGCGLVIGVTSGAFSGDVLQHKNPHHLIEQIPELLALME
jgi:phosphonatase-like hydrolase